MDLSSITDISAGWLFASLVVSSLGLGVFIYGKRQSRLPQLVTGLALMVYPLFVSSTTWMLAIGGALLGILWIATRAGL